MLTFGVLTGIGSPGTCASPCDLRCTGTLSLLSSPLGRDSTFQLTDGSAPHSPVAIGAENIREPWTEVRPAEGAQNTVSLRDYLGPAPTPPRPRPGSTHRRHALARWVQPVADAAALFSMELVWWICPVRLWLLLPSLLLGLNAVSGAAEDWPTQEGKEAWDYVTVRKDARMFWWLYYATNPCKNFSELPLVMWLQGGPGGSSTGFGNFEEIGPLDTHLKPRNTTWLQSASLLFVDNPVGTGFSYVNTTDAYAKDLDTVASDMMVLLKSFFDSHKEFQTVPFYIFSESYGGKMAAGISLELYKAIQQETIKCNFSGVALGDSWISPVDSVLSWGPYLYSMSLLDSKGLAEVSDIAEQILDAINKGFYKEATQLWGKAEMVIEKNTDGVNFYNILTKSTPETSMESSLEFLRSPLVHLCQRHVRHLQGDTLSQLMNGPIRKKLKIIPEDCTWGGQSSGVFISMEGDFMKPVIHIVDQLLEAGVNVIVYNGQLDLIVTTMGQEAWMQKLKWPHLSKFNQLKWKALYSDPKSSETSAFLKSYENLTFYWILRAGHMVPSDQGDMALKMMRLVTQQE